MGMERGEFSFSKRKGRIVIVHKFSNKSFSYILKKDISLDPKSHDFIDIEFYEIKKNNQLSQKVGDWNEVIKIFFQWLGTIR